MKSLFISLTTILVIFFSQDTKAQFAGGDGSSGTPWQVSTAIQLDSVRHYLNDYFVLVNDIDLSIATGDESGEFWNGGEGWVPIGTSEDPFTGELDGNTYVITGLTIIRPGGANQGLFGYMSGSVSLLGIEDAEISGDQSVGIIAGWSIGTISNSYVSGTVVGFVTAGGIIGYGVNTEITSCYANVLIDGGVGLMGGLAGYLESSDITSSYANVTITGMQSLGGLVGAGNDVVITTSYSVGSVIGTANNIGGLLGQSTDSYIYESFASVQVEGSSATGGLVGLADESSEVNDSYWNTETSGQATSEEGGTGLTTVEMFASENYANFDFNSDWDIYDGFGFPFLQNTGNHRVSAVQITGSEGWRMMSAPMDSVSYGELLDTLWTQGFTGADYESGAPNVFTWDEITGQFEAITDANDYPGMGTGFLMYVFDDQNYDATSDGFPKTLLVEGTEDQSSVNIPLSYTDAGVPEGDGWNLVGNPWGFPLDWAAGFGWTRTNLDASFYVWNAEESSYQSHNGTTGTLPDSIIAPWQAFWVKANDENPSLSLTQQTRGDGGVLLKKAPASQIHFTLLGGELVSGAILHFDEDAEIGKDPLDAYKLQSLTNEYLSLGTSVASGEVLDIQALPMDEEVLLIDLDIQGTDLNGVFTLEWNPQNIPGDWALTLIDNVQHIEQPLKEPGSYSFNLSSEKTKVSAQRNLQPKSPVPVGSRAKASGERFVLKVVPGSAVSIRDRNDLPDSFGLEQNYPNPFNPSSVIRFQLPVNSEVSLKVFDVLGREVATMINGRMEAGYHQVTFNARELASGMYIYQLRTGDKVFTKKLTLIK